MNNLMDHTDLLDADDLFEDDEWYGEFDGEFDDEFDEDVDEDFDDEFDDEFDEGTDELAEAMSNVFDSLTPAEAFNIGSALGTIGKGAAQVVKDPTVRQIAATTAPIAGGALGSVVGGPGVGTAVGTSLGAAAGKALAPTPPPAPSAPVAPRPPATTAPVVAPKPVPTAPTAPSPAPPKPAAAQGSAAATKALVMSQQPDVLKCLLSLALGEKGRSDINGIPVGAVMSMLASIYSKAAEDADELLYSSEAVPSYLLDAEGSLSADPAAPRERADALYAALIGAENEYLAGAGLT